MEEILSMLMAAQKVTKLLHWKTKSFAKHIALDELYESLIENTDELAEMWMGKYGNETTIDDIKWAGSTETNEQKFVSDLFDMIESMKSKLPDDEYIENKYQELQADVATAKYKIDNLS